MPLVNVEKAGRDSIACFYRDGAKREVKIEKFVPYFYDDKMKRVEVTDSKDVPFVREMYPSTYEADIPYPLRYMIDNVPIPIDYTPLRISYLDIEVDGATLDVDGTPEPIICITCFDTILNKYITFIWREDLEVKVVKTTEYCIYYFKDETTMLTNFFEFIKDTDIDIIAGWSIDTYDIPYIINRAKKLGLVYHLERISPLRKVYIQENKLTTKRYFSGKTCIISGRYVIDLRKGYKQIFGELSSYSLSSVAQVVLGVGKEKYLKDIWKDLDKLIEYNRNDVRLTVLIDKEKRIINFYDTLRRYVGCTWSYTAIYSKMVDTLLLRKARHFGQVLRTSPKKDLQAEEVLKGGVVFETHPGIHKSVIVLDLATTYPSIIQQFNISYDTFDEKSGDIKVLEGATFFSEKRGLLPIVLKELMQVRSVIKSDMKKCQYGTKEYYTLYDIQFALKCVTNSGYGALANSSFRFFNPKLAQSITFIGRELVTYSAKIIKENFGYETVYADTDSLFVSVNVPNMPLEEMQKIQQQLLLFLNNSYADFVKKFGCKENKHIEIVLDRIYSKVYFSKAKKRYVGYLLFMNGQAITKLHLVGFESKRSDTSKFAKEALLEIFQMVLDEKSKSQIDEFVRTKRVEFETLPLDTVAIPKNIVKELHQYNKNLPQIRGSIYYNEYFGGQIYAGTKVKMLYVEEVLDKPNTNVICFTEVQPDGIKVDYDKMFKVTLVNKVNKIYESFGYPEYQDVYQQTNLLQWFGV